MSTEWRWHIRNDNFASTWCELLSDEDIIQIEFYLKKIDAMIGSKHNDSEKAPANKFLNFIKKTCSIDATQFGC